MPNPLRSALGAALLASVLATTPLVGQQIPSAYRFVETGQEVAVGAGVANLSGGRFGFGPKEGLAAEGRWSIHLSGPLAFELAAGLLSGTRDVIDPGRAEDDRVVGEADLLFGRAEGRLLITLTGDRTWNRLAPFVSLGGGMIFDLGGQEPADEILLPEDRFDFGSSFLATAGLGTRLHLSDRFALRGEGTFSLYQIDTPPGFSDPDRGFAGVEESEWVSGLALVLSLGYRF